MGSSNMDRIIIRAEAKALGLKHYFIGEPCKHGHIAERRVCDYGCIECGNIKVRRWYWNNTEQARETARDWAHRNPEKQAAYSRKRRAANPEYHKQYVSKWRDEHPEEYAARLVRWRAENPEKVRASGQRRRAREKGAGEHVSAVELAQLYLDQGGLCLCGKTLFKHHTDHRIPISRGGSNAIHNLQLLCQPCNDSKGARTMLEWRATTAS